MADPETLRVYDAEAQRYADLNQREAMDNPALRAFLNKLPQGARVLDLGSGPGTWAAAMARAGCVVEAIDASAEMVALAAKHPGVRAWQARFADLKAKARYDGIWANFSLLHAPRVDVPDHLRAIHRALRPGGYLHIAVKQGSGEKRDPLGRLYTYFTEEELTDLLRAAGLTPSPFHRGQSMGLDGVVAPWIQTLAQA